MIDSHTHMYCDDFDADRAEAVKRAQEAGVSHLVLPNENLDSLKRIQAMHEQWPSFTSMTIGLHPEDVDDGYLKVLEQMKPLAASGQYVAVGEVGIDLYWDATWRSQQVEALTMQLEWCRDYNLPFIIHCRNGLNECLEAIDRVGGDKLHGVMHSFTGTVADVERVRRHGDFYFGVNGIATFKKSQVPDIIPAIGLNRLLLETDSPYLAPVPHRGKRNESAFVPFVCQTVARIMGIDAAEVERATDANACRLFGLSL